MQACVVSPVVLLKIATPSLDILMTSGMQVIDFGGDTYTYCTLRNIITILETDDLKVSSISLTFSAVNPATIATVSAADFFTIPVQVIVMFFDENWLSVVDCLTFFEVTASSQNIALGNQSEIMLTCKTII